MKLDRDSRLGARFFLFLATTLRMRTIREELIEVRNKLDELIKQLETETEVTTHVEEPLGNIIFNAKLFNTPEKLTRLKRTIGRFISNNPAKDERKIHAETKNQFFYLYASLWSLPDVLADESMVQFVRQMAQWFPEYIPTAKKEQRNYERSLSHEKQKWEKDGVLLKVMDWKSFIPQNGMQKSKAVRYESLSKEIFTVLNLLIKQMRNQKH